MAVPLHIELGIGQSIGCRMQIGGLVNGLTDHIMAEPPGSPAYVNWLGNSELVGGLHSPLAGHLLLLGQLPFQLLTGHGWSSHVTCQYQCVCVHIASKE